MDNYNVVFNGSGMYEQEVIDTILENRGIKDKEHFLNPVEDDLLPYLDNMDNAYSIVMESINNNECIGILYDVDADGITSGTIITRYLKNYTDNIETYINQGKMHGLIGQDISRFSNCDLVIIVDSLDKDTSMYDELKSQGKKIIVLDHHNINEDVDYDSVVTLVSSQRNYENKDLSGAGVTWKFCKYIDEMELNDFADDLIDLAAIGILADVMDVSETSYENRYIISEGLHNQKNLAVKKILGGYEFNSKSVLFSISPLINACMRCGNNEDAMNMFLTDDNKELLAYKKKLESYKVLQNEELDRILPDALAQIENQKDSNFVIMIIDSKYGIAGLVGNKLLDVVNRPLAVISWEDEDFVGGSMRSVGTKDFRSMVNEFEHAQADGHENAAGITIEKKYLDDFIIFINDKLSQLSNIVEDSTVIDAELHISDVTKTLAKLVHDVNFISGKGFKPLKFKVNGFNSYNVGSWSKGKHLVLTYEDDLHTFIEWNTKADFSDMEDNALMNEEIIAYGEIEDGFVGRKYIIKLIMDDYKVGDDYE